MADNLKKLWLALREQNPDPLVRRLARVLAGLFLLVVALALYAPALGNSRFVFGTDTVSHDYVMHYYGWVKSIGELGEVPLWNPYLFSGLPMIGSAALCPYYPSQWLYLILPFNTAFTMQYVLALVVGGVGAGWWMRTLGHRRLICVWAGFLYMVSGHFLTLTHAGHLQKMIALGWTPVALGATYQLVRLGKSGYRASQLYKTTSLLGLALGMQMLASHPQILYGTAAACFLQLFGLAVSSVSWKKLFPSAKKDDDTPGNASLRPVGQAVLLSGLALIVCCVVSAVQFFPSLEMSAHSNRAGGVNFAEAVETSYPPLEIFEYAIPRMFGDSVAGAPVPYFGAWGERIVSDYIGLPVLFLAVLGVFGSRRRYRWFLLILFFAGLLIGLGRYLPLYWLLYHVLPGFDGFRSPGTFMFLTNCALIGLAAFGLEYLINLAISVNDRGWGSSFEATTAGELEHHDEYETAEAPAISDTQPFEYQGTDTPPHNESIEYDEDPGYSYDYAAVAAHDNVSSSNFTWDTENTPWLGRPAMLLFIAAIAVTALIAAIIALGENYGVNLKTATQAERVTFLTYSRIAGAAIAVMVLCAALLLLRLRAWTGAVAVALVALVFPLVNNYYFLRFEPLPPYLRHLTKQPELVSLAKEAPQPVRLLEQNLLKNEGMLYGVGSPAGYHPIMSGDYALALSALGPASDSFGSLFAINFARTTNDKPPVDGHWVPNADENTSAPTRSNSSVVWRRAQAAPYLRNEVELVKQGMDDDLSFTSSSLRSIAMDTRQPEADGPTVAGPYLARVSEFDVRRYRLYGGKQMAEAQLQRWTPHEIRLHTRAAAPGERQPAVLPVSEPVSPGWRAETSAGTRLPIISINGVQRGLVLPPGELNVRMIYSPYSYRLGLFVSLMGVTTLLCFGIGTLTRRVLKGKRKVEKALRKTTE